MGKLDLISSKIYTLENIRRQCMIWRFKEQKIVFTNGCFDILHLGHIEYLAKASELGQVLVIGLNSDLSVRKIKGEHRPINPEYARAMLLASLSFVSAVVLFDEDTPYELIKNIQPDILVKGNDYKVEDIAGHDIVLANGGKVITIELTQGFSTTGIEERILHLHKSKLS